MSGVAHPEYSALPFIPKSHSVKKLREAAQHCHGCPLFESATQTVFGEGHSNPTIMLVGEQPGDQEDIAGRPFVGPAGKLLDICMTEAGISREHAYVTNMVKHFKWVQRGKRRIHDKPNALEITACKPWLEAEIESVQPKLVIALGATAAQGMLGKNFRVTRRRGEIIRVEKYPPILATVHPSSLLRQATSEDRHRETHLFIADLKKGAEFVSDE